MIFITESRIDRFLEKHRNTAESLPKQDRKQANLRNGEVLLSASSHQKLVALLANCGSVALGLMAGYNAVQGKPHDAEFYGRIFWATFAVGQLVGTSADNNLDIGTVLIEDSGYISQMASLEYRQPSTDFEVPPEGAVMAPQTSVE